MTVEEIIARATGGDLRDGETIIEALEKSGYVVVPKEPPRGLLISMAIRDNHAFLVTPHTFENGIITSGVNPEHRESVLSSMRQLYEEVVGTGFWSHERDAGYVESFNRAATRGK